MADLLNRLFWYYGLMWPCLILGMVLRTIHTTIDAIRHPHWYWFLFCHAIDGVYSDKHGKLRSNFWPGIRFCIANATGWREIQWKLAEAHTKAEKEATHD